MARLSFRCDDWLVGEVDRIRGPVPREAWLRDVVMRALANPPFTIVAAEDAEPAAYRQSVPGPNVENVRSSSQSKRDVRPIPKGGKT